MGADDSSHIWHTAVATLEVCTVKKLMVPVMSWKVLVHQLQEFLCYTSGDVLVVGWVKPGYLPLALLFGASWGLGGWCFGLVSTFLQGVVVSWYGP